MPGVPGVDGFPGLKGASVSILYILAVIDCSEYECTVYTAAYCARRVISEQLDPPVSLAALVCPVYLASKVTRARLGMMASLV